MFTSLSLNIKRFPHLPHRYNIRENRWSLIYHQLFIHIQEYSKKFKSLQQ